jgi:hypothetical protein
LGVSYSPRRSESDLPTPTMSAPRMLQHIRRLRIRKLEEIRRIRNKYADSECAKIICRISKIYRDAEYAKKYAKICENILVCSIPRPPPLKKKVLKLEIRKEIRRNTQNRPRIAE